MYMTNLAAEAAPRSETAADALSLLYAAKSLGQDQAELLFGALVLRSGVTRAELTSNADAVRSAAARTTKRVGGHDPWSDARRAPKCRVGL
jgi:hypothetical protein